jgi:hypothetical protein
MNSTWFVMIMMVCVLTGCNTIGMLLFYKGTNTNTVYRSSGSKKSYLIIKAIDYKSCGCTELVADNYHNKYKTFTISFMNGYVKKHIYRANPLTGLMDTIRLMATSYDNFTVPFDSADLVVFKQFDSIAVHKPKGIAHPIGRYVYKGYIAE